MLTGYLTTLPTDILLSAGVLYCTKAGTYVPIGVTDGAPDFDGGSDQAEIMFDNRAPARLKGLTRVVGYNPVIKGTLKEFGSSATGSQIPVLEPGEIEATVSTVTTATPKPAGSFFASNDYIIDFRWIFERASGGYACIYAPLAIVRKYTAKGNDKKEAQIAFEIECVGDPVNDLGTGPYAIELRTSLPTGAPTTPAQLFAALNAASAGGGVAMDLYIDGSSPVPAIAAVGLASLTTVVDGTLPSGRRCTKWESAINPGTGKHWRPSSDYATTSGTGANSDGISVKGAGLELPSSVGYSGTGCHPENTSATATTPGSTNLLESLMDYTSGLQYIVFGKQKNNTTTLAIGEDGDPDLDVMTVGAAFWGAQGTHFDPNLSGWLTDDQPRVRFLMARWINPTTTKGVVSVDRFGRDFFVPFGGLGIWNGTSPALNGSRRVRLGRDGGWNVAPQCEYNIVIPVKGRFNSAQWKLLCDTVKGWWPDTYEQTQSVILFSGDSQQGPIGGYLDVEDLMAGVDGSPAVTGAIMTAFPQAGNNMQQFQWPFIRMIADGDPSLRPFVCLLGGEFINDETSLPDNYFVFDWWRHHGPKWKGVIFDFADSANFNKTAGDANRADIAANWASHADGHFDPQTGFAPFSTWNWGDGHDSSEGGHAYPVGQNPVFWGSFHIWQEQVRSQRVGFRSASRFMVGLDASNDCVTATLTPDHVTLTAGSPTANPTITNPKNWLGAATGAKTWTHDIIDKDGNPATSIATVVSNGTITRVAVGHVMRRSISNDGARVYVDVNCT